MQRLQPSLVLLLALLARSACASITPSAVGGCQRVCMSSMCTPKLLHADHTKPRVPQCRPPVTGTLVEPPVRLALQEPQQLCRPLPRTCCHQQAPSTRSR